MADSDALHTDLPPAARPPGLSLHVEGEAAVECLSGSERGEDLLRYLNEHSRGIAEEISERVESHLRQFFERVQSAAILDFGAGIRWQGLITIFGVSPEVHRDPAFVDPLRTAIHLIVTKTVRQYIENAAPFRAEVLKIRTKTRTGYGAGFSARRQQFLWWCAGAIPETLQQYPTERVKYEGIGGAVLTTGVLAFFSGFYAIYTTLSTGFYGLLASLGFGLLWALAIFNLDRYIVASLRKPTDRNARWRERLSATWLPALPRLGLAVLIGITLSKPLELRLFHNAVEAQAQINRDEAVAAKRASLIASSDLPRVLSDLDGLNAGIAAAEERAQSLEDEFRKESDGTGGSLRYGYSEVARVKEAAAVRARQHVIELRADPRKQELEAGKEAMAKDIDGQVDVFRQGLADDFLSRMKALSDLSASSPAVWWISSFVVFLLAAVEITPVLVKLLSAVGPYDVKLDAINRAEIHEMLLRRGLAVRLADQHYANAERAGLQAEDALLDLRTSLADEQMTRAAEEWKAATRAGAKLTIDQFVDAVRGQVIPQRN